MGLYVHYSGKVCPRNERVCVSMQKILRRMNTLQDSVPDSFCFTL